jgi:hypothetical protein
LAQTDLDFGSDDQANTGKSDKVCAKVPGDPAAVARYRQRRTIFAIEVLVASGVPPACPGAF